MLKSLTRRRRVGGLLAAGAAAALIAAGCSSGGSDPLSLADYREQADNICREADSTTDTLDVTNADDLQRGVDAQREQVTQLRELEPPDEIADQHNEAVGVLDQITDRLDTIQQAVANGEDVQTAFEAQEPQLTDLGNRADELANEIGLEVCSSDGGEGDTTTDDALTPAPPDDGSTDATNSGSIEQYQQDLTAAATALQGFSTALRMASNPDELKALAPALSEDLDQFDASIEKLGTYTVSNEMLDQQRQRITEVGPRVSDALRSFVDAAVEGDLPAIQALVPELSQALTEFTQAGGGTDSSNP